MEEYPKRIVITGMGCLTPIGEDVESFWSASLQGTSGVGTVETFDASSHRLDRAAEISDFDPLDELSQNEVERTGRASAMGAIAARQALEDAGLERCDRDTVLTVGSTLGDLHTYEKANDEWYTGGIGAMPADRIRNAKPDGFVQRIGGPLPGQAVQTSFISNACSSGNSAFIEAIRRLRSGEARFAIAGGCDAFSRVCLTGFTRLGIVSPDKCRPFDKDRDGAIFGEGAGFVVLESLASARERGIVPYAEFAGYGMSCDASSLVAPDAEGRGLATAMRGAIEDRAIAPESIDYVGAHGTATPANDSAESTAILSALGEHGRDVPVSSIKPMIGHTLGASSALHAILCTKALLEDKVPPTINFETPDPECPVDCVPNEMRETSVEAALCNSAAFGGNNTSILLTRFPEIFEDDEC